MLLLSLGTPDAPEPPAVRRYLAKSLGDPDVTPLPRGLRWLSPALGRFQAALQAKGLSESYRRIWTDAGSPMQVIAGQQTDALAAVLPAGMQVFYAQRYGRPTIGEILQQIRTQGIDELVAISMYPQYCGNTTLPVVRELYRQTQRSGYNIDVTMRSTWYDDAGYINAQARLIHDYARAHELTPTNTQLVYSLRSLPISRIKRGDPYMDQIHRTAELVSRRLGWPAERITLGYQGGSGSVRWLQPTTAEVLADLAKAGETQVFVCPLGFSRDCLETLSQLHIRYRAQFQDAGGRFFACPALNTYEPFIAALRNLVLHGRHPVAFRPTDAALMAPAVADDVQEKGLKANIDSLVMVGTSLDGRLGAGGGPAVAHIDADAFRDVKKTQCEVPDMLRGVCQDEGVREALLWNTCRRFEFYGWLDDAAGDAERDQLVSSIGQQMFNQNGREQASTLAVLHGVDAWRYLMRTAAGLNSGLPGEREVLQQLQAALRLAERAGAAGPLMNRLLNEVAQNEQHLREQTEWGRFQPEYCHAAIARIVQADKLDLRDSRCVIIGGSSTSCGIIEALAEHFGVPRRRLTLLHRGHGHGGHLKMLRRAIGNGRRLRVQKYNDKSVIRAIADADVVFIGLDRKESIIEAEHIRECRDFAVRPLAIIDFNMFGSTRGMEGLDGVRVWSAADLEAAVAAYADEMCSSEHFAQAAEAAEAWIAAHAPHAVDD